MKRLFAIIALFLASFSASGDGVMLNAVATTATSASVTLQPYLGADAQIWSAAGSTATVLIECRSHTSAPWWPCQSVVNPDATGAFYTLPYAFQYRLRVSAWTAGTISGTIIRYAKD